MKPDPRVEDERPAPVGDVGTESELRESEERFRLLADAATEGVFVLDGPTIVEVNGALADMLGYRPEELIGLEAFDVLAPEWREPGRERIAERPEGRWRPRMLRKDGSTIPVEGNARNIAYRGRPARVVSVLDLSEREETEQRLREAEEKYRTLVERIPAVVYFAEYGTPAPWLYISPKVERMLGFPPEEWLADPLLWYRQIHPDDRERVLEEEESSRSGSEPLVSEYRMLARDGHVVWIRDEAEVVLDERGEPALLRGVMYDITDRVRSEELLREAEARFRALVEHIPALTYTHGIAGERMYVSPQVEAITGFSAAEWLSNPDLWIVQMHPDDRERVLAADALSDETGRFSVEFRTFTKDGRMRWLHEGAVVIRDGEGAPLFWQGVAFDITERKQADDERQTLLARLVAAQEEERARIAEDIHDDPIQAMTAVGMRLETLRRRLDDRAAAAEALDSLMLTVGSAIARLRHLMFELHPRSLDEDGLTAALGAYLEEMCEAGDLGVELNDQLSVQPDRSTRTLLYRIAQEALSNVRKHANADKVEVSVVDHDEGFLVRVRDDGIGFEPTAVGYSPTGHLGLSSMRERAEMAGGWWRMRTALGQGTTVEFWLPGRRGDSA